MPGHKVARSEVKDTTLFDKYQCPHCARLLKNAVQGLCGHWLCESCVQELLQLDTPKCPRLDCQEDLTGSNPGMDIFPDRFVRREIEGMIVYCTIYQKGCKWEGRLGNLEDHLRTCEHASSDCPYCRKVLTIDQMGSHTLVCPKALVKCPLAGLGCSHKGTIAREELEKHVLENQVEHLDIISAFMKRPQSKGVGLITPKSIDADDDSNASGQDNPRSGDVVESDYAGAKVRAKGDQSLKPEYRAMIALVTRETCPEVDTNGHTYKPPRPKDHCDLVAPQYRNARGELDSGIGSSFGQLSDNHALNVSALREISAKMEVKLQAELRQKDEEISSLRDQLSKMEKSMRSKHAEFDDRDFKLSLIENSNYDGSMIWKIPQFSQRMSDAQTGKYTSIFSLPFYTGRCGYKMCLRLYILGDGIGKNSHMSLFFVVMKGEFDNELPWPFTHKVSFKLISQTGGSHITDTFQPDPMSSSFRKPKSDMNIASGCPRFVSHTALKSGDFIVDDTVFIKCSVDLTAAVIS